MSDIVERLREEGLGFGIGPALVCQEAAAEITRLRSELARAREKIEELQLMLEGRGRALATQVGQAGKFFADTCRLEHELARAREALEPFGTYPEYCDDNNWPDGATVHLSNGCSKVGTVTLGDLRRARAALQPSDNAGLAKAREADYFSSLVERARVAAAKAAVKFPQPNFVALKIAEEAGEVVRGAVHYAEQRMEWSEVEGEIVQLLAMLIRFVTEGDQVNGITPPALQPEEKP